MDVQKWAAKYKRAFALDEIENSTALQYLFWALIIGFVVAFQNWYWQTSPAETNGGGHLVCPFYFQECRWLLALIDDPAEIGNRLISAIVFALLCASSVAAVRRHWALAHFLLIPVFLVKFILMFVLYNQGPSAFEYFHLPFVLIFLFLRQKLFFSRLTLVILYFLSATMKHHEAWVVGTYFSSVMGTLPLVPDSLLPWATNAAILFETIGPWFLLSSSTKIRGTTLMMWIGFHLFSIVIVGYRFPLHCVPLLLALFGNGEKTGFPALGRRPWGGWVLVTVLLFLQSLPFLISGKDFAYTLEGKGFGVQMFESNHQCVVDIEFHGKDGNVLRRTVGSRSSTNRCPVYATWYIMKSACKARPEIARIQVKLDKAINGGPFYRLVDTENICALKFRPFRRNEWIRTPDSGAPLVGYASRATIRGYFDTIEGRSARSLIQEVPQDLTLPSQAWFLENYHGLLLFWRILWFLTLAVMIVLLMRKSWEAER